MTGAQENDSIMQGMVKSMFSFQKRQGELELFEVSVKDLKLSELQEMKVNNFLHSEWIHSV